LIEEVKEPRSVISVKERLQAAKKSFANFDQEKKRATK